MFFLVVAALLYPSGMKTKTPPMRGHAEAVEWLLRRYTATELAAKLGVTAQSIENWRNGIRPQPRSYRALLNLLAQEKAR